MAKYRIERWDPVWLKNNTNALPMIYIKPDQQFIDFANQNQNSVIVKIEGTGTIYDGHAMIGIVSPSDCVPNARPNFFKATGFYVIILYGGWYEYPKPGQLGTAIISGLQGEWKLPDVNVPPYKFPNPFEGQQVECYDNSPGGLNFYQLVLTGAGIITVLGILLWSKGNVAK